MWCLYLSFFRIKTIKSWNVFFPRCLESRSRNSKCLFQDMLQHFWTTKGRSLTPMYLIIFFPCVFPLKKINKYILVFSHVFSHVFSPSMDSFGGPWAWPLREIHPGWGLAIRLFQLQDGHLLGGPTFSPVFWTKKKMWRLKNPFFGFHSRNIKTCFWEKMWNPLFLFLFLFFWVLWRNETSLCEGKQCYHKCLKKIVNVLVGRQFADVFVPSCYRTPFLKRCQVGSRTAKTLKLWVLS